MLNQLSETGNDSATYLLSRIYFESKSNGRDPNEIKSAEIDKIRDNVKKTVRDFEINHQKAHELLCKALEQNKDNYQALYELGLDYWRAGERTDVLDGPDAEKAEKLFDKALELAHKEGRQEYIDLINDIKSQIKVYWENSSLIE